MSAKKNSGYKCSSCGYTQPKWLGRCPECGEWNSFVEYTTAVQSAVPLLGSRTEKRISPLPLASVDPMEGGRISTGIAEFDLVLGGGATKRSAILIGGEPGIGKSTLLLQTAAAVSSVLYVSGEESGAQIRARADRLDLQISAIQVLCTSRLEDIEQALDDLCPALVIIDSIQTVFSHEAGSIPGTVNQLKYCAHSLVSWVKERDSVLLLSAHITKDGAIAGPKSLEHIVDTVISFERNNEQIRFLRAQKNRFGSVDELGIFVMHEKGLAPLQDPAALFMTHREGAIPHGVALAPVFEGSRVFLVEIQALTVSAKAGVTRVYSEKIDNLRVSRVAAVLEKCAGLRFSDQDIYVHVAGGIRLSENAIDAALACALYSARTGIPVQNLSAFAGELSLAGEIRPIGRIRQRIRACTSLGLKTLFAPEEGEMVSLVSDIKSLIRNVFAAPASDT